MKYRGRASCLVIRDNKILMVKHKQDGIEYYCLPGGGIEKGETPEQAAVRELKEECLVNGTIINMTCICNLPDENKKNYTFHINIGEQEPKLGYDPEIISNPILIGVKWLSLNEICERDRAYLWAAGLASIREFTDELDSWSDDISYPEKRGI